MAERSSRAHHAGCDDPGLWEAFGVAFGGDKEIGKYKRLLTC